MTTLTPLIEHHCPNGVEYVELKEVLKYEQPGKYLVSSTDYDDSFSTAVLTAGKTFILGYTDETTGIYEASPDDPVIIFDDFTTAFKWVDFPFKAKSSAMKMLTPAVVDSSFRYIFYAMHDVDVDVTDHKRQWIRTYSKEKIPLPPREVQDAIVERLDVFATLIESLDSEITLREERFEYFREQILTFDESDCVEYARLGDVAEVGTGKCDRKNATDDGEYPFFVRSEQVLRYPTYQFDEEAIIVPGEGGIGEIFHHINGKYALHQRAYRVHFIDENVSTRYALYAFKSFFKNYVTGRAVTATVASLRKPMFTEFQFPLPSLDVQQDIVDKLDTMQALIDNLKQERELRKAQFEYYREKLLTFNS